MQSHLLVGPNPVNGFFSSSSFMSNAGNSSISASPFNGNWYYPHNEPRKPLNHWVPPQSSLFASAAGINGEQNHYSVLGIARNASSVDIKQAYRLLARKYHPDVCKDSRAGEVFKSVRHAYERGLGVGRLWRCGGMAVTAYKTVLSNEVTRIQYDRALTFQEDVGRTYKGKWNYSPDFEDGVRIYRWAEV